MVTIDPSIYDAPNGFGQVNIYDTVNGEWGCRKCTISADDIQHLINGGCLYYSDGEYATIIALEGFNGNKN